jgi:hypothetical protein
MRLDGVGGFTANTWRDFFQCSRGCASTPWLFIIKNRRTSAFDEDWGQVNRSWSRLWISFGLIFGFMHCLDPCSCRACGISCFDWRSEGVCVHSNLNKRTTPVGILILAALESIYTTLWVSDDGTGSQLQSIESSYFICITRSMEHSENISHPHITSKALSPLATFLRGLAVHQLQQWAPLLMEPPI